MAARTPTTPNDGSRPQPLSLPPLATPNVRGTVDRDVDPSLPSRNHDTTVHSPFTQPPPDRRRFDTLRVLGHGAYAWVEEVRDNQDGDTRAMKVVPAPADRRERVKVQVDKEVEILRKISGHCHIVELRHAFADSRGFCILVSPVADFDLSTFYGRCAADDFPEEMLQMVRMWFSCLAHGLAYIHSHRIRHKDIKPQNILVKDGKVLFADFGLSKDFAEVEGLSSTTEGYTPKTPMYAAPEVIQQKPRRYSADVFSLGCIYAELATILAHRSVASFSEHRTTYDQSTGILSRAFHCNLTRVENWLIFCGDHLQHLIRSMLQEDPFRRPQAVDLQTYMKAAPELLSCTHLPPSLRFFNLNIVLLGDRCVGKTALVISFLFNHFLHEYDPTIEDSHKKNIIIDDNRHLLQIIDTAGQDTHVSLREKRIREAHGFLIVYSISNRASFERVAEFTDLIHDLRGTNFPSRCCTLVGTKSDLVDRREVSAEEGNERAGKLGFSFIETSAVLNKGIKEAFIGAASQVLDQG